MSDKDNIGFQGSTGSATPDYDDDSTQLLNSQQDASQIQPTQVLNNSGRTVRPIQRFDGQTGQPIPQTGQPAYGNSANMPNGQPIQRFDGQTGKPIPQAGQPAYGNSANMPNGQPIQRFDGQTGKPIPPSGQPPYANPVNVQNGQPVQRFDSQTGQPIPQNVQPPYNNPANRQNGQPPYGNPANRPIGNQMMPPPSPPAKKKSSTPIIVISIFLGVIVVGCVVVFFLSGSKDKISLTTTTEDAYYGEQEDTTKANRTTTENPLVSLYGELDVYPSNPTLNEIAYVIVDGSTALYSGPAGTYFAVSTMPSGTSLTVFERQNGWAFVQHNGIYGWCAESCIGSTLIINTTRVESSDSVTIPVIPPDQYFTTTYSHRVIANGGLFLRSGPGKENAKVLLIPEDAYVTVIGYSNNTSDWYYVDYNGKRGWVFNQYLQ